MKFQSFSHRHAWVVKYIPAVILALLLFSSAGVLYVVTHAAPNCYTSFYELPQSVTNAHETFSADSGQKFIVTVRVSLLYSNTCQSNITRFEEIAPAGHLSTGFVSLHRFAGKGLPDDEVDSQVNFPLVGDTITSTFLIDSPGLVSPYSFVKGCYKAPALYAPVCTPILNAQESVTKNVSHPTLPSITLSTSQYVAVAIQDAKSAGISPDYFVRQISAESGFDPNALSPAGAIGIAQFEPGTAAGLGINPYDPIQSLSGAARLMASYAMQYNGDFAKALAAYNAGGGNLEYAVNTCGDGWLRCVPAETQNYISKIMGVKPS